jgi:hypothetical protein
MSKSKDKDMVTVEKPEAQSLTVGKAFSLTPTTLAEAFKLAELIANSDLAPKDFKGKAGNCLIAMQMGMEVGLAPMQAIQNIAVINGRPTLWGDAALALVLASSVCQYVREAWDEKTQTWTCRGKRKDAKEEGVYTFSIADAQKAGLTKKEGTWQSYPKRMIQMRARAFCLRDNFADVLKGLAIREEVEDYVETTAEPAPIMTPKPKEPEAAAPPVPANGNAVLLPGEYSYFLKQMDKLGADLEEVKRFAKDKFGLDPDHLDKLTKDQAKQILVAWNPDPPAAA